MRFGMSLAKGAGLILALGLMLSSAGCLKIDPNTGQRVNDPGAGTSYQRVYRGNTQAKTFHRPRCRYYYCQHCTELFKTRAQAIRAGYRPCKVCKP